MTIEATETKLENGCPSINGDDVDVMVVVYNNRVQRLLVILLSATMDKIRDAD